jgi:hypothetical protein
VKIFGNWRVFAERIAKNFQRKQTQRIFKESKRKEFSKKANAKNFQRKQTQRIFKENTNTAKRKSFQKKN